MTALACEDAHHSRQEMQREREGTKCEARAEDCRSASAG